jgi:hypothetical protein
MIELNVKPRVIKYPTYDELLNVIGKASEPQNFYKILDAISCEPDCIELEYKLDRMVELGMLNVQTDPELGFPHRAWSVSELYL